MTPWAQPATGGITGHLCVLSGAKVLFLSLLTSAWAWGSSGCGISGLKRQVRTLDKSLAVLHRKVDKQNERIETLSNQLFILEDRVDSNRVALRRKHSKRPAVGSRKGPEPPSSQDQGLATDKPLVKGHDGPPRLRVVRLRPRSHSRRGGKRIVLRLHERSSPVFRPLGGPAIRERIPVVPIPSAGAAIPPPGPIQEYRAAYRLYTTGRYAAATKAFAAFAARHPHHDYADNALFWMGQSLYKQKRYKQAASTFRRVLKRYPSGNKAPDALLKLGLSLKAMGARMDAKRVLTQVVDIYQNTRVGRIASKVLDTMR